MTLDLEERNSVQDEGENPHQTRIHVSPSLNTADSMNDLVKYLCIGLEKQSPTVNGV